jgi:hypothetical protein
MKSHSEKLDQNDEAFDELWVSVKGNEEKI